MCQRGVKHFAYVNYLILTILEEFCDHLHFTEVKNKAENIYLSDTWPNQYSNMLDSRTPIFTNMLYFA